MARTHSPAHFDRELIIKNLADDEPIRLDVAAMCAFPDGSMRASGLRREAARGRLLIERIAGKDYTTLAAIKEMRKLCHSKAKEPDSGYSQRMDMNKLFGSSVTENSRCALDAARASVNLLRKN